MKIKITKSEDIDEARELHKLAFPADNWVGEDHEYWFATDEQGHVVAFASAFYYSDIRGVYLSRCGVLAGSTGHGLQRRLIRARCRWAKSIGAWFVFTYTTARNYASITNLLRSGFFFARLPLAWKRYHFGVKPLYAHVDTYAAALKAAELVG